MSRDLVVRRVYDPPAGDGYRVLVDRLWPRGLAKDAAHLDEWCKDVAPSSALRRWYGHDPARFEEFRSRYLAELGEPGPAAALAHLAGLPRPVVLLTAVKELELGHASVLVRQLS